MANRKNREGMYNAAGTHKYGSMKKIIILSVLVTLFCIFPVITVIASDSSLEGELNFADYQDPPPHQDNLNEDSSNQIPGFGFIIAITSVLVFLVYKKYRRSS